MFQLLGERAVILFVANQKSSLPVNHFAERPHGWYYGQRMYSVLEASEMCEIAHSAFKSCPDESKQCHSCPFAHTQLANAFTFSLVLPLMHLKSNGIFLSPTTCCVSVRIMTWAARGWDSWVKSPAVRARVRVSLLSVCRQLCVWYEGRAEVPSSYLKVINSSFLSSDEHPAPCECVLGENVRNELHKEMHGRQ